MAIPIIGSFDLSKDAPIDIRMQVADATARLALKWVYKGLLVYQADNGKYYRCDVDTRSQGSSPWTIAGDWTEDPFDIVGTDGADGSVWFNGAADPIGATGEIGDYFLQTADGVTYFKGDIFEKTGATTWTFKVNLAGADGLDATDGYYGNIYVDNHSAGTPQVISTSLVKLSQFDTDGLSNGITVDHTTDRITAVNTGVYVLAYSIALSGSIATYTVTPHVNGSPITGASSSVSLSSTSDVKMLEVTTLISLTAADYVELYAKASAASKNFLMREATLSLSSIGSTGATGAAGQDLQVDAGDVSFYDGPNTLLNSRDWIEVNSGASASNRYIITVLNDYRTDTERLALATTNPLRGTVKDKMIAWDGTSWYVYGTWRGPKGDAPVKGVDYFDGNDGADGVDSYREFAQWVTAPTRKTETRTVRGGSFSVQLQFYLEQMQTADFFIPTSDTYTFRTNFRYRSSAEIYFSIQLIRLSGEGGSELATQIEGGKLPTFIPSSVIPVPGLPTDGYGLGEMEFSLPQTAGRWFRIRVSLIHGDGDGVTVDLNSSHSYGAKISLS